MRRWIAVLTTAAIGIALVAVWLGKSDSPSRASVLAAQARFEACVESAPRPLVGGDDPSVNCLHTVGSALPRCDSDAPVPVGIVGPVQGRSAITTDDGHGGRCAMVLSPDPGGRSAGCAAASWILGQYNLRAKRYTGRRCPPLQVLRRSLTGLRSGRTGLIEVDNRSNVVLDLAPDGVPRGGGFRRVPPRMDRPVPALRTLPTSGACGPQPGHRRLVTAGIEPDVPLPRCMTVGAAQGLRIVNDTGSYGARARAITVRFIGFSRRVKPGRAAVFPLPVGRYLAPGDHLVTTSFRGNGPEVMFVRGGD